MSNLVNQENRFNNANTFWTEVLEELLYLSCTGGNKT